MKISVIIPTHNRCKILAQSLGALVKQNLVTDDFEIIVINDGSTDQTKELMLSLIAGHKNIIYLEQKARGPAAARNAGIRQARGKYIFFTGDDIIAPADLLMRHLELLEATQGLASLGYTNWADSITVSKFMEFLMSDGHQFNYLGLKDGDECSWKIFITANIALERKWLASDLFDENLPFPAWEDLELGYRLHKKGLKIIFNKNATAYHAHEISEDEFYNKTRQSGVARAYIYKKHPELETALYRLARTKFLLYAFKIVHIFAQIFKFFRLKKLAWQLNIWYYAIAGIHDALYNPTGL